MARMIALCHLYNIQTITKKNLIRLLADKLFIPTLQKVNSHDIGINYVPRAFIIKDKYLSNEQKRKSSYTV